MSFDNNDVLNRSEEDRAELLRRRKEAMFGNRTSDSNTTSAVFPMGERVNLPIELIDENPDNREVFSLDNIDELAENMNDIGFSGAIEVFAKDDGRYEISAGHRRKLAVMKNKQSTIPAIISPMPDEITKAKKLISSNIHQRTLTPYEYSRAVEYYRNKVLVPSHFKGNTIEQCSKYFMKSVATIKRYIAISKLIPELQELTKNPTFPYASFEQITQWEQEEQMELYNRIMDYKKANPELDVSQKYILQEINFIKKKKEREFVSTAQAIAESNESVIQESPGIQRDKTSSEPIPADIKLPVKTLDINNMSTTPASKGSIKPAENKPKREKQLPPIIPLIKTYSLRLKELDLETYNVLPKESTLDALDNLISAINDLKNKIEEM